MPLFAVVLLGADGRMAMAGFRLREWLWKSCAQGLEEAAQPGQRVPERVWADDAAASLRKLPAFDAGTSNAQQWAAWDLPPLADSSAFYRHASTKSLSLRSCGRGTRNHLPLRQASLLCDTLRWWKAMWRMWILANKMITSMLCFCWILAWTNRVFLHG